MARTCTETKSGGDPRLAQDFRSGNRKTTLGGFVVSESYTMRILFENRQVVAPQLR